RTAPRCRLPGTTRPTTWRRLGTGDGSREVCQLVTSASPCSSPPSKFALIDETRKRFGVTENPAVMRPLRIDTLPFDHSMSLACTFPSVEKSCRFQEPLP